MTEEVKEYKVNQSPEQVKVHVYEQDDYEKKNGVVRVRVDYARARFYKQHSYWVPGEYQGKTQDKLNSQHIIANTPANQGEIKKLMAAYLKAASLNGAVNYKQVVWPKVTVEAVGDYNSVGKPVTNPGHVVVKTSNNFKFPPKYLPFDARTQIPPIALSDATPEKPFDEPKEPSNGLPVSDVIKDGTHVRIILQFKHGEGAGGGVTVWSNLLAVQFLKEGESIGEGGGGGEGGRLGDDVMSDITPVSPPAGGFDDEIPGGNPAYTPKVEAGTDDLFSDEEMDMFN